MKPFKRCPICGGELEEKEVEKLLRGGRHTASLRVPAEVCLHCGERLYDEATVMQFERIRSKLKREELSEFKLWVNRFRLAHQLRQPNATLLIDSEQIMYERAATVGAALAAINAARIATGACPRESGGRSHRGISNLGLLFFKGRCNRIR